MYKCFEPSASSGDGYKTSFQANVKYSSCWPCKNEN